MERQKSQGRQDGEKVEYLLYSGLVGHRPQRGGPKSPNSEGKTEDETGHHPDFLRPKVEALLPSA